MTKKKISYGVACFSLNDYKEYKVLCIKKRCTYSYINFITSTYNYESDKVKYISHLFNNMTVEEKIIISSLNFDNMWFYGFLCIPTIISKTSNNSYSYNNYLKYKNIFTKTFITGGNSVLNLSSLISQSKSINNVWEIPKGRKNSNESNINCALREFEEETGISKTKLTLITNKAFQFNFIHENVNYTYYYYLAFISEPITPIINMDNKTQICEVGDIKWLSNYELLFINDKQLILIFNKMKKFIKNKKIFLSQEIELTKLLISFNNKFNHKII